MFGRKVSGAAKSVARAAKKAAKAERKAAKEQKSVIKRAEKAVVRTDKNAAKTEQKTLKQADKSAVKAEKRSARAAEKSHAQLVKAAEAAAPESLISTLTNPKTARKALAVAKIAGPALAPIALRAATSARGLIDERRAARLGVDADQVAAYRGPTGPAAARITGLRNSVDEIRQRRGTDLQVVRFADVAKARLADLTTAVQTSASMPTGRRRATLQAVGKELNQIEADLMTHLVGTRR